MFLPAKYVPLVLSTKGYTSKGIWDILIPAFQQDNVLDDLAPIVDWLRASLTNNGAGVPSVGVALFSPPMDMDLYEHRADLIRCLLPGLGDQTQQTLSPAIYELAQQVATSTAEMRASRIRAEEAKMDPKTPTDKFGLLLDSLLQYMQLDDEALLPHFWHQLAQTTKKQEYKVIFDYFSAVSRTPDAFINHAPIPTPSLISDILTIHFTGNTDADWKVGINPFVCMDGNKDHRAANLDIGRQFMLLTEGTTNITLSDLSSLKLPANIKVIPTSYFDFEKNLGMFGNLLLTLFGAQHAIVVQYRQLWVALLGQHCLRLRTAIEEHKTIHPIHILCSIQLKCFNYFEGIRTSAPTPPPNFVAILTRFADGEYTPPDLPAQLHLLVSPNKSPTSLLQGHTRPLPQQCTSDKSVMSALSGYASYANHSPPTTSATGTFVENPSPDYNFQQMVLFNVQLHQLTNKHPLPTTDDNRQLCVTYHVRRGCNTSCKRNYSHRPLSATEQQCLENFLADCMVAATSTQSVSGASTVAPSLALSTVTFSPSAAG
jgi:hypothetical protein